MLAGINVTPASGEDNGVVVMQGHFDYAVRCRYNILTVPEQAVVSRTDIKHVLSGFGIFACQHMRLNDPQVIKDYNPHEPTMRGNVLSDVLDRQSHARCRFPTCRTEVYWQIRPAYGNDLSSSVSPSRKTIYLHVHRYLGSLEIYDGPVFLSQLIMSNTPRLTKLWNESVRWKDSIAPVIALKYEEEKRSIGSPTSRVHSLPRPDMLLDLSIDTSGTKQDEPLFFPLYKGTSSPLSWFRLPYIA